MKRYQATIIVGISAENEIEAKKLIKKTIKSTQIINEQNQFVGMALSNEPILQELSF